VRKKNMKTTEPTMDDRAFAELRRKIREAEVLSAATEKLLLSLRFNGRLSIVVKNGWVLKSGYEEGYFAHREGGRMIS
jgi:hypothetical protein